MTGIISLGGCRRGDGEFNGHGIQKAHQLVTGSSQILSKM